jgi:hypothetical protein
MRLAARYNRRRLAGNSPARTRRRTSRVSRALLWAGVLVAALLSVNSASAFAGVGAPPLVPEGAVECSSMAGTVAAMVGVERRRIDDNLSTTLSHTPQKLNFTWEHEHVVLTELTSALCLEFPTRSTFFGAGQATLDGEPGYHILFKISVTAKGKDRVVLLVRLGEQKIALFRFSGKDRETVS